MHINLLRRRRASFCINAAAQVYAKTFQSILLQKFFFFFPINKVFLSSNFNVAFRQNEWKTFSPENHLRQKSLKISEKKKRLRSDGRNFFRSIFHFFLLIFFFYCRNYL